MIYSLLVAGYRILLIFEIQWFIHAFGKDNCCHLDFLLNLAIFWWLLYFFIILGIQPLCTSNCISECLTLLIILIHNIVTSSIYLVVGPVDWQSKLSLRVMNQENCNKSF